MTTQHSKLPPSSAARRMACPGSRAMCERHGRNEENEASKEGTKAHELAARFLPDGYIISLGKSDYTDEMFEGAAFYRDVVTRFLLPENTLIEKRVNIGNIHPDMWGTPDAWGVADNSILHVFDYKFGYTPVDPFENWQLLAYACGIVETFNYGVSHIYLHIVQPRDYVSGSKHKVWNLSPQQLEYYRHRLVASEALASSPNAELRVSAECKYCLARHACPALREAAFGATEIAYRDIPQGIDSRYIGNELKFLHEARDLLDYRITALETEVQYLIQSGVNVDHYELTSSTGRMTWTADTEQVLELGLLYGINLRKDGIVTPTQAIKAGLNEEIVLKYVERKSSLKLSKVDVKKAQAVFGK